MAARVRIERRDAHQPMHAQFGLQPAVRVVALDHDRRRLDAGLVAGRLFDHFDLELAPLAPAHVHAQQHARPVAALGAAGAGMHFEIGVVGRRPRPTAAPRAGAARPRPSAPCSCREALVLGRRRRPRPRRVRPASSRRRARARSWRASRAGPPAWCARASASARLRGRSRGSGPRTWRSVRLDAASPRRRQRCLLSSPTDCLIVSTSCSASARMGSGPSNDIIGGAKRLERRQGRPMESAQARRRLAPQYSPPVPSRPTGRRRLAPEALAASAPPPPP